MERRSTSCARLPHCVGVVTDLDEGLAERAITSLDAEIRRRERLLRDVRADDLTGYRRNATDPLPRLVVVVDEFAALAKEHPDVLAALIGIAQRGRSLGVHLVLATQRPAGVVTDEIRANTNLRLALRVHDRSDANGRRRRRPAGDDPRSVPGRAVLRLGPDELVVFQTASCTGPLRTPGAGVVVDWDGTRTGVDGEPTTELESLVAAIGRAADLAGVDRAATAVARPAAGAVGAPRTRHSGRSLRSPPSASIDDPAAQTRRPLQWRRESGNLLIVGGLGTGTTTTASAVVTARLRMRSADQLHLYVVDGRGEPSLDAFAAVAHCGGVVRASESERLDRLLRRLVDDLERGCRGGAHPEVILLVDGIEAVRALLASVERTESAAMLDRIVQGGPAAGIVTCATTDGSSPAVLASVTGERWVHHLDDPSIARAIGLRGPPPRVPGRLCVAESGLVAQVVTEPEPLGRPPVTRTRPRAPPDRRVAGADRSR